MRPRGLKLVVCLFLVIATVTAYWQVRNHGFVNYDDDLYVTNNRNVQAGLTWDGVKWAFTTTHASNWHPLTWLSHMLDYEIYGPKPGGHHLSSLLFHAANTLLLFFVLSQMSGALWRSGFVAALFALHPLHVESVAWVAERKDVLSTFFWLLTMWAYARYAERPGLSRYLLVLLLFAFGLMSKPMLVTLPFVMLLLDYWPLNRLRLGQKDGDNLQNHSLSMSSRKELPALHLILEKVPFLILAGVASVVTLVAQQHGGAVRSLESFPLGIRIANALVSYATYIGKMIWPQDLAVFYPHPRTLQIWQALGAAFFLACVCFLVVRAGRRRPYLMAGWLWYLGTLVPVIGLVQVGSHAMADRYTYVPLIGLFVMISWGMADLATRWRFGRPVLGISTGVVVFALIVSTWFQVGHWHNSETLFKHTLKVTANNYIAHNNLAIAMVEQGKLEEAIDHYSEALRIKPRYAKAHYNLGIALMRQGNVQEAIAHYSEALRIKSDYAAAHNNLGKALAAQGNLNEAIAHYFKALRIEPDNATAHGNLGVALAEEGKPKEAIRHFSEALRITPGDAKAHKNLGAALAGQGRLEEAIRHYATALRIAPGDADTHFNLGHALTQQGRLQEAIGHFSEALRINPADTEARKNLRALEGAIQPKAVSTAPKGQ